VAVFATFVAVLAGGAWLGARFTGRRVNNVVSLVQTAGERDTPVTFVLRAPGATCVSVVGDFNNWDAEATPMAHSGSGDLWVLNVRLPRGVHLYSFVLDGSEWRPDPSAPLAADGSFGAHNSVIVVDGAKGL
jgi:1,4-alpha-glucan branching enzyme